MAPHPLPAPEWDVSPSEAESPDGIDLTLIHWMLSLTPLERLEVLQDWVDGITELRNGRIAEQ